MSEKCNFISISMPKVSSVLKESPLNEDGIYSSGSESFDSAYL